MVGKSEFKRVVLLMSGLFAVMLVVRFTAYSQQPFWDILIPWEYLMVIDLLPVEGFNTDADGQYIDTAFRRGLCVAVNFALITAIFWGASRGASTNKRRVAQISVFTFVVLWYLFLVMASMLGG